MKKWKAILCFSVAMSMLAGCATDVNENANDTATPTVGESENEAANEGTTGHEKEEASEEEPQHSDRNEAESEREDQSPLSNYSSEQIEYARVWMQLGPNQDVDELYVEHIPAGTKLDPEGDIDVTYPEDVIQMTGSRLVDGIVTYSGNGDGTIYVYEIPRRWYGGMAPPKDLDKEKVREDMETILANKELVYVEQGEDAEVIRLIEKLQLP